MGTAPPQKIAQTNIGVVSSMPKSMTGYGRGECVKYDRRIKVEIKSVNHRYSDVAVKLPRFLNPLEDKVRRSLAEHVVRGKVDVWISFESFAQKDVVVNVNKNLADAFIEALAGLSARYEFGSLTPSPALELLARNPDIISLDKFDSSLSSEDEQLEVWETLQEALDEALDGFNQMRTAEGIAMAEDIESKRTYACQLVEEINVLAPIALAAQGERLKARIADLTKKMEKQPDDARLVTELAIIADKGCVSEEITRLRSHFSQLSSMLLETDAMGRKLDFLIQELNREANTISSKTGDVEVTGLVVDLKSTIEKMREQAQNME